MKKLCITALILILVSDIFGQAYYQRIHAFYNHNPVNYGILANTENDKAGIESGWKLLLDTGKKVRYSSAVAIPFAFKFNNVSETHFKISNTGFLTFDTLVSGTPSSTVESLPTSNLPSKTLAVLGIIGTGNNDQVLGKTFGTAPNRQYWVKFSSYSLPGDTTGGWNYASLVLEESSNKMYIVRMAHNNAYGNLDTPVIFAGLQVSGTNGIAVKGDYHKTPSDFSHTDNVVYEFVYGIQPKTDLGLFNFKGPDFAIENKSLNYSFNFINAGSDTISEWTQLIMSNNITSSPTTWKLKLKPNGIGEISSIGTMTIPAGKYLTLKIWSQNPNKLADEFKANDTIIIKILSVKGTNAVRVRPMVEYTTAAWCEDCAEVNYRIENYKNTYKDSFVFLRHHIADAMASGLDSALSANYGAANIVSINRPVDKDLYLVKNKGEELTTSFLSSALKKFNYAPVDVELRDIKLDSSAKTITFTVYGTFSDYCPGNIRIGGAVLEDALRGAGTGWDQQLSSASTSNANSPYYRYTNPLRSPYHNDVAVNLPGGMKGVTQSGDSFYLPGETVSHTYTYKFKSLYEKTTILNSLFYPVGEIYSRGKPMDMKAVGWIAIDKGHNSDYYILNSNVKSLWDVTLGAKKPDQFEATVYPNPGNGKLTLVIPNGRYQIKLLNTAGAEIFHNAENCSNGSVDLQLQVSPGIYLLQAIHANGTVYHTRIVIQ